MVGTRLRRFTGLLSLVVAAALVWSATSCSPKAAPTPPVSYPAIGTVVNLPEGRIRATGVVGQYPLESPSGTYGGFVLYSRLGSTTTSVGVIASLDATLSVEQTQPLAPYDGKIVTVEGVLRPPQMTHFASTPWSHIAVASIATAPPEVQVRIPWSGSLVKPGRWFDTPWKHTLTQVYEEASQKPNYPDVAQARKAFRGRIPEPHSALTGRLVSVVVPMMSNSPGRPSEWYQFYATGLVISGPFHVSEGPGGIASMLKSEPGHPRSVRVNGEPGIITTSGTASNSLWFWGGKGMVSVGTMGPAPGFSDDDLLAIANSCTW